MSKLIVVGYDERFKAEEVRIKLQKLQREYLLDLEDAVVAFKDEKGRIKLDQAVNLTAKGAASGGFWGALVGLIFLNPLTWLRHGCSSGRGFRRAHRCWNQRQFHEGIGRHNGSRQFDLIRPGEEIHTGQGVGRARGNRRPGIE